jgi:hypothetical protein
MALSPEALEARIWVKVAELRVLAAKTAVDWGRATMRDRYAQSSNPILRAMARRMPPPPPPPLLEDD